MKNRKLSIILFLAIIVIAAFLRLYKLGQVPPSPDWDEAALGYNAYSIMLTGRDEYGEFFPLILRSFDDYKPALYSYLIIPFIKVFGLNIVSVRLPSVIFGIFTVIATFLIVRRLFSTTIALMCSFLLAISPWHIQFSRIAFESNVGLAINVFIVYFFLKSLGNPWFLPYTFLLGASNLYMYQGEKVFTPLLLLSFLIIFRKEVLRCGKKWILYSLVIAFIISLPMLSSIFSNQNALMRAKGVSVFSDQTEFLKRNVEKLIQDKNNNDYVGLLLDNRRFEYARSVIAGYIAHFDLNWLFITGDLPRHHAPYMGLLYLFELPFLLIGIYQLIFGNYGRRAKFVVFSIFLLAPIPASITSGVPHAIRTLNFLPTFQVFAAIGLLTFISKISNITLRLRGSDSRRQEYQIKYFILVLCFIFFMFNFLYYFNQYFVQLNYYTSKERQYGYKEAIEYIKPIKDKYNRIVVSNKPPLDQSYMFFLFYLQYPPSLYQKEVQYSSGGFRENHYFGKYEFRPIEWDKEEKAKKLFIGRPDEFPEEAHVLKKIYYLNGEEAIKIIEGT